MLLLSFGDRDPFVKFIVLYAGYLSAQGMDFLKTEMGIINPNLRIDWIFMTLTLFLRSQAVLSI